MKSHLKDYQINIILNAFVLNQGNLVRTAREAEISPNTLRKILKGYPELMAKRVIIKGTPPLAIEKKLNLYPVVAREREIENPAVVAEKVEGVQKANAIKLDFMSNAYKAKEEAVQKIRDLIESTSNIDVLQKAVKTLHEITKEDSDSVINNNPKIQKINYLQIINNNLIAAGYGIKKPSFTKENNEKPTRNFSS